jgi:cell division septation protein DedD
MRGFLDDDDYEPTPQPKRDTELTLGYFTLFGIFFGLIVLCVLCFGLGYEVGRRGAGPVLTLPPGTPAKASTGSKPSGAQQAGTSAPSSEVQRDGQASLQPAAPANQVAQQAASVLLPVRTIPAPARPQPLPPSGPFMVQITAVSNPDDGELLVNALRKHGYQVTTRREGDGLIHVRLGPFSSRDDASRWRQKLINDGYSATIQQ